MTDPAIKNEAQVSQLCVDCGFCCSGVLYDQAKLEHGEGELARDLGMDVAAAPDPESGKQLFNLPCPLLCGTACSIYRQTKPKICSRFFCELAVKLDRGEISQTELAGKVAEAQALMARIEPLLLPDENWSQARERWHSQRNQPPKSPSQAQFQVLMTALNLFLLTEISARSGSA